MALANTHATVRFAQIRPLWFSASNRNRAFSTAADDGDASDASGVWPGESPV